MNIEEQKFALYLTVLRFLPFKITQNLQRIYLRIDEVNLELKLTAYYLNEPSELELELFDDIITNSNAHIPAYSVTGIHKLFNNYDTISNYDFVVFALYEP